MQEVKSSGVAIVLSFFWTGLGQLYAGRIPRGLLMMAATPFVWALSWMGGCSAMAGLMLVAHSGDARAAPSGVFSVLLAMLAFGWWVWGMLDAKKLCERHNAEVTQLPLARRVGSPVGVDVGR